MLLQGVSTLFPLAGVFFMKVIECINHHKFIIISFVDKGLLRCPICEGVFIKERIANKRDKKKIEKYRHKNNQQKELPKNKERYPCSVCRDCEDWSEKYSRCISNLETCDDLERERNGNSVEIIEYVRGLD